MAGNNSSNEALLREVGEKSVLLFTSCVVVVALLSPTYEQLHIAVVT
jgi:hypothetical protein